MAITKTISQAIYEVRSLLHLNSDDTGMISNRFIYNKIKSNRSLIYSRQIDKHTMFGTNSWQKINCYPLELTDISECCDIKLEIPVSKGKFELPNPMNYNTGKPCVKAYTLDLGKDVQIFDVDKIVNQRSKKYKNPIPSGFIPNNYLYVEGDVKAVVIRIITDDPEEVELLNECKEYDSCGNVINETCPDYLEMEFNVQGDLWEAIRDKTAKDIATFYGIAFEDKENNARNDSAGNTPFKRRGDQGDQ